MNVAVVGGGGHRLTELDHVRRLCAPIKVIQVNHHPLPMKPDYICFLDDIDQLSNGEKHKVAAAKEKLGVASVSIREGQADIIVEDHKYFGVGDSGMLGIHFALKYFGGLVFLCGFDLRTDAHPNKVEDTLKKWRIFLSHITHEDIWRLRPVADHFVWEEFGIIGHDKHGGVG